MPDPPWGPEVGWGLPGPRGERGRCLEPEEPRKRRRGTPGNGGRGAPLAFGGGGPTHRDSPPSPGIGRCRDNGPGVPGRRHAPGVGDTAPRSPPGRRLSEGGSLPSLTLTKSSMRGSLSSSFSPFSGIDKAMVGSAALRGRRRLLLSGVPVRVPARVSPTVPGPASSSLRRDAPCCLTPRARLPDRRGCSGFKLWAGLRCGRGFLMGLVASMGRGHGCQALRRKREEGPVGFWAGPPRPRALWAWPGESTNPPRRS